MDAIRNASLITFVVLSVIYIAIQAVSVWLASIFGFAGVESKKAWEYTHKFNNAVELERWMENQRGKIAAHADHKLRMLQMKLSKRTTTDSNVQAALKGAHGRDFNAYVLRMQEEAGTHRSQPQPSIPGATLAAAALQSVAVDEATLAVSQPTAPALTSDSPVELNHAASPTVDLSALRNKDLTAFSDEQLGTICRAKGYELDAVLAIRAEQQLLKDFEEV
jgi:hypothetical protein